MLNAFSFTSNQIIQVSMKFYTIHVHVLIDLATNNCYLNSTHIKCIELHMGESNNKVVLENGIQVELKCMLRFNTPI